MSWTHFRHGGERTRKESHTGARRWTNGKKQTQTKVNKWVEDVRNRMMLVKNRDHVVQNDATREITHEAGALHAEACSYAAPTN